MTSVPSFTVFVRAAERAEERVGLEHLVVGRAEQGQLVEVVHHHHGVGAGVLGRHGDRRDPLEELGAARVSG